MVGSSVTSVTHDLSSKQLAPHRPTENEPIAFKALSISSVHVCILAEVSNHGEHVTSHMIEPAS